MVNAPSVFAPLRLRGGDTYDECQENMDGIENECNVILVDNPSISSQSDHDSPYVSNENDPSNVVHEDGSMSEQDIRHILFDAGYTIEDINDAIVSKSKSNESVSRTLMEQSVISESEPAIDNSLGR